MMLFLCRADNGKPVVAEVVNPRTVVDVVDVSEHHVTVLLAAGPDELRLLISRDVAALLVLRLLPLTADHVAWLQQHLKEDGE